MISNKSGSNTNHKTNGPAPKNPKPNTQSKRGLAAKSLIRKTKANNNSPTVNCDRVFR